MNNHRLHRILFLLCSVVSLIVVLTACNTAREVTSSPDKQSEQIAIADTPQVVQAQPTSHPRTGAKSPEEALSEAFKALEANDMNTYIDVLDPDIRAMPNNPAVLGTIIKALSGVSVDTGSLAFRDMQYQITTEDGTWAGVYVTGALRMLSLGSEVPIDEVMLVRNIDGRWYVSSELSYQNSPEGIAAQSANATTEAQQALVEATAIAEATATAEAEVMNAYLQEVQQAISDGDEYIAAAMLQQAILQNPDHEGARAMLQNLPSAVPGALVSSAGYYYDFTDTPIKPIPGVQGRYTLDKLAHNGTRALVGAGSQTSVLLDLKTGQPIFTRTYVSGLFSSNLTWVAWMSNFYDWVGIAALDKGPDFAHGIGGMEFEQVNQGSVKFAGWLDDSRLVIYREIEGKDCNAQDCPFTIWDTTTGTTQDINLIGFRHTMNIVGSPNPNQVWILANGQIIQADLETGEIKPVPLSSEVGRLASDEPIWEVFALPDNRTLYSYFGNTLISTVTGRMQPIPVREYTYANQIEFGNVVGWTNALIHTNEADNARPGISISPSEGTRGTTFTLKVENYQPEANVYWEIYSPIGEKLMSNEAVLDSNGESSSFVISTDLGTSSGEYRVEVYYAFNQLVLIGKQTFKVQ